MSVNCLIFKGNLGSALNYLFFSPFDPYWLPSFGSELWLPRILNTLQLTFMALVQNRMKFLKFKSNVNPWSKTPYGFLWWRFLPCILLYTSQLSPSSLLWSLQLSKCALSLYMLVLLHTTFPFSSLANSYSLKPAHESFPIWSHRLSWARYLLCLTQHQDHNT